ncbi:DUF1080 domain-containing protein [Rhodopirellula sp. SWK7]|uniref:3-keto-disaccharide hydrolase n=1 Tax=Rhodopirellula sp. SWK7 TaxID=595460 RepID=UPI0002BF1085|nr:DUF1080 domain-containing protein [Rhodopirellula sp. SWK7]EMI40801.1 secreted protein containing DUF1080 [Rhodopirellula sp. SWK7]
MKRIPQLIALIASLGLPVAAIAEQPNTSGLAKHFRSVEGWKFVSSVEVHDSADTFSSTSGASGNDEVLLNGDKFDRSIPYLYTANEFGDVSLRMEFTIPKNSNSGVYFMGRYEIQVYDSFGKENVDYSDLGGLYQRWIDDQSLPLEQRGYEGVAPNSNASKAPGQWQTMEVVFRAPRFDHAGKKIENAKFISVKINGKLVHENIEAKGPTRAHPLKDEASTGPIAIQGDHGPIAIRRFEVTPLTL